MVEPTDATRVGIECLTLWMEPGTQARVRAAEHISELVHGQDGPGAERIIAGLLNLSMFLVYQQAKAEGAATASEINERAHQILQELSPRLPET